MKKLFAIFMMVAAGALCFAGPQSSGKGIVTASVVDETKAEPMSGGVCGYDDECNALVFHACSQTINGQKYTPSLHANANWFNTSCIYALCGYNGLFPIFGLVLPAERTTPGPNDIPSTCSDGTACYHLACESGQTGIYREE